MRILLTGASGQLGPYIVDRILDEGHHLIAWSGRTAARRRGVELIPVDLMIGLNTERLLDESDPDVIIHAAAMSSAEAVRRDPTTARSINLEATGRLADWSSRRGRKLVFTSTDLVFDGSRSWSREDDLAEPIVAYGRTKRDAERLILAASRGVVARLSLLFGLSQSDRPSFFGGAIDDIRAGRPRAFFDDEFRTPLDLASAADVLVRLASGDFSGTIHVAGRERISRFELMRRSAVALGLDAWLVQAGRRLELASSEARPADVSLDTTRLASTFPDLDRPTIERALRSA